MFPENNVNYKLSIHLFLNVRFSDTEIGGFYTDSREEGYTKLRKPSKPGYIKRNEAINSEAGDLAKYEKFLSSHMSFPPTGMDWGAIRGFKAPFKTAQRSSEICDISHKSLKAGSNSMSKFEAQSKEYNLVVLNQFAEHVTYSVDMLMEIHQVMREDSVLYIEVPFGDIIAR